MKIVLINAPFKDSLGNWIALPPDCYGGIQWCVTMILRGYLDLGHVIYLLGAPNTQIKHPNLNVINVAFPEDIFNWLEKLSNKIDIDIIHDHSNNVFVHEKLQLNFPVVATSHLTGTPRNADYHVFLSKAQQKQANISPSHIIRIPIDPRYYNFSEIKENYFLFLGRVSPWKGVYEAALFSHKARVKLVIAGPAWETEYLSKIFFKFKDSVEYIGEVAGEKRKKLIANAKAILVFSQTIEGPWGDIWCEPGSTVVSEGAISGTPIISTNNGCLAEIVPPVGTVIKEEDLLKLSYEQCKEIISNLQCPINVRSYALKKWHYLNIANEYIKLFEKLINDN